MKRCRLALVALASGLGIISLSQALAPSRQPPLYDGVVVQEPYRYVSPAPSQPGDPSSYSATRPLEGDASPAFVAATAESPPQAQLIAAAAAFRPQSAGKQLDISITPVAADPPDSIVGNAYRITVTDDTGRVVPVASGATPTLVLRAPEGSAGVMIVQLVAGAWQELPTQSAGASTYIATVGSLGEFAVRGILPELDPRLVLGAIILVSGAAVVLWFVVRSRSRPSSRPVPQAVGPRRRRRRR